jgi:hypothetical protein
MLSSIYEMLYSNLASKLTPYIDEVNVDHQCEFRHNKSTNDHIFCIRQILEK